MSEIAYLEVAAERLRRIEELLLRPTPQAIHESEALLNEAAKLVADRSLKDNFAGDRSPKAIDDFRVLCDRVAKLLEGARRVQWIRMRLITSLTQTYSAGAQVKTWSLQSGTVNVSM